MLKKILSSNFIWRLTGITYYTASIAIGGRYLSKKDFIREGKDNMSFISPYLRPEHSVLEFGCGLGRNLFSLSNTITSGLGIDINKGFIRQAKKLGKMIGANNISFIAYDGKNFPNLPRFDIIFEIGVFERLPKQEVKKYLETLSKNNLKKGGIIVLYFLMDRAKNTIFTRRLGNDAYVYWTTSSIKSLLFACGLEVNNIFSGELSDIYVTKLKDQS